ncbi:hypothetical protein M9H77_31160 [Catharanthus roseus]|uniref:Uncharacterized protein n=1 Tax=Catharanthus roseus TaxID=4058 RepID=A0ACC0A1M2_CATRO|nr:hypothetical protein M9H77_31160 [Catharanthus roseus]
MTTRYLDEKEYKEAMNYILLNWDEVETNYTTELRTRYRSLLESDVQMRISEEFSTWFREEMLKPVNASNNEFLKCLSWGFIHRNEVSVILHVTVVYRLKESGELELVDICGRNSIVDENKEEVEWRLDEEEKEKEFQSESDSETSNIYSSGDLDTSSAAAILESSTHFYSFTKSSTTGTSTGMSSRAASLSSIRSLAPPSQGIVNFIGKCNWYTKLRKRYRWDLIHKRAIWDAWEKWASLCYKDLIYKQKKMGETFAQLELYVLVNYQKGQWVDTRRILGKELKANAECRHIEIGSPMPTDEQLMLRQPVAATWAMSTILAQNLQPSPRSDGEAVASCHWFY